MPENYSESPQEAPPLEPGADLSGMHESVKPSGDGAIIYDASLFPTVSEKTFSAAAWRSVKPVENVLQSGGRGYTLIISDGEREFVLRHYRRGGLIGRVVRDSFLWTGQDQTRSFDEWRTLHKLYRSGLPVPRPAVARYCRRGPFYTADLITVRIRGIRSLSVRLTEDFGGPEFWQSVGRAICRFHDSGVNHADLSAHNIQVEDNGKIWLLDFDRAKLMPAGPWRQTNLARLHRSLQKIERLNSGVHYTEADWEQFLAGYFQASRSA